MMTMMQEFNIVCITDIEVKLEVSHATAFLLEQAAFSQPTASVYKAAVMTLSQLFRAVSGKHPSRQ